MYVVESPGNHVRRSSRRHAACTIASEDVYNCTELMEQITSKCEWNSLTRMGNCTLFLRRLVQDIIRRRITVCLERFLSGRYHARFFQLLETTDAAIVGGFVRHLMCLEEDIYRSIFPAQLSILVPVGSVSDSNVGRKWVHFLSNCVDYEGTWQDTTPPPYSMKSSRSFYFNRTSSVSIRQWKMLLLFANISIRMHKSQSSNATTITYYRLFCAPQRHQYSTY